MGFERFAATALSAAALGVAVLGFGAGTAKADDWQPWVPSVPHVDNIRLDPLPPGQAKKLCPWQSPPGHWIGGPHGIPCT